MRRARRPGRITSTSRKQLREIARDKHYWEQKRDRIRLTDRKVEELEQNYAEQLAKIRAERQEILKKAKQEARQLIADANKQIENTIKTIREAQAEKELTRLARRELDDFREAVEQADDGRRTKPPWPARSSVSNAAADGAPSAGRSRARSRQPASAAPQPEKPREVVAGSKVRMAGQEMVGVVQSVKGKRAQVAFGQILTTVDKGLLTVVSNNEYREATRPVDGPYGALGGHLVAQTQLQGSHRRARHAGRRCAGRGAATSSTTR